MQFREGMVVRSMAGHDKNRFYVIVKIENESVFIADGKRRKVEDPKRKNPRHLHKTNTILTKAETETNRTLRRALHPFNYGSEESANTQGGNPLV